MLPAYAAERFILTPDYIDQLIQLTERCIKPNPAPFNFHEVTHLIPFLVSAFIFTEPDCVEGLGPEIEAALQKIEMRDFAELWEAVNHKIPDNTYMNMVRQMIMIRRKGGANQRNFILSLRAPLANWPNVMGSHQKHFFLILQFLIDHADTMLRRPGPVYPKPFALTPLYLSTPPCSHSASPVSFWSSSRPPSPMSIGSSRSASPLPQKKQNLVLSIADINKLKEIVKVYEILPGFVNIVDPECWFSDDLEEWLACAFCITITTSPEFNSGDRPIPSMLNGNKLVAYMNQNNHNNSYINQVMEAIHITCPYPGDKVYVKIIAGFKRAELFNIVIMRLLNITTINAHPYTFPSNVSPFRQSGQ